MSEVIILSCFLPNDSDALSIDSGLLAANGLPRSPSWRKIRASHLEIEPRCLVCNGTEELTVHHWKPYHLFPELELERSNLGTLCERLHCHLISHGGDYRAWIPDGRELVEKLRQSRITRRYER